MRERRQTPLVGIVGLGHVGLCTAVAFASQGVAVMGIDIDSERVSRISNGKAPFFEEGLASLLPKTVKSEKLRASTDSSSLAGAKYIFIAVPTPSFKDGSINLRFVKKASTTIGDVLWRTEDYKVVVVKSTVTPGTTLNVVLPALTRASGKGLGEFGLASNPEFLREGHAIEDTLQPDRIVIGTEDSRSERTMLSFYRKFYGKMPPSILTTAANAELVKYASNSFLATKVTFINEIAKLCAKLPGTDVSVVAKGMGLDGRIGSSFLGAGLGFGGSCLPKDVSALLNMSENIGVRLGVVRAAAQTNKRQPLVAVELAEGLVGDLRNKRVALLGLAFKPESDDMRDAVSLELIQELVRKGATIVGYDPAAMGNARRLLGDKIEYAKSARALLKGADCCILVTEWPEFSGIKPAEFRSLMRVAAVVDGRRVLDPQFFLRSRVKFAAVGLGAQSN